MVDGSRTLRGIGEAESIRIGEEMVRVLGRWVVYAVLVVGAAVFSFPFVWMAATSVKVDREMQAKGIRVVPITPRPRLRSPYIDEQQFAELEGAYQAELLPGLEALVRNSGVDVPATVDRVAAEREVARGLYEMLVRRTPAETWEGRTRLSDDTWSEPGNAVETVLSAAGRMVEDGALPGILDRVYRRVLLGPIRLRTYDRKECLLAAGRGRSDSNAVHVLTNLSTDIARMSSVVDKGQSYALVRYDFCGGPAAVFESVLAVPDDVDLRQLHRIQVPFRPDDTWHELWLSIDTAYRSLRSVRPVCLANFEPAIAAWQPAGGDDNSTRIKTWTRLDETGGGDPSLGPRDVRIRLELRQVSRARAWINKLRANYEKVFDHMPFWRYLRVSLFLVVVNISLTLVFSSVVAYAFARLQWPGREFCFMLMLSTMMIPFQVIMIPRFLIWKNLGAYNTLTPLWLGPVFGNAFFVFLLRQFMKGIPRDLEDAARIDGCGFMRIYFYIILPLIKPSLAAIAIFTFIGTWNNFMGPLLYIADQRLYPLAFGLYAFSVQVGNNPALTMAGSLLMTLPVIVIFFFAQKYFIQGITLTGMKQ